MLVGQTAWAATNTYCRHEQGAAAQHFGHHMHVHQTADQTDSGTGSKVLHADCSFCHVACAAVVTSVQEMALSLPRATTAHTPQFSLHTIFLDGPERPKWAAA
jgi:cytochrome c5